MCRPVHLTTFHHQEETVLIGREHLERLLCHLCKRRNLLRVSVNIVGESTLLKQCPYLAITFVVEKFVFVVLYKRCLVGDKMFPDIRGDVPVTTPKHHIQVLIGYLGSNGVVFTPLDMMCRKIGRRGVGEFTGDHQPHGLLLLNLQCLEDGSGRLPGACTIYRKYVIVRHIGMNGYISRLLYYASS